MNTKIVGTAFVVVAVLSMAGTALAYRGDYQVKGPNATPEREASMSTAMQSGDYTLWKSLMEGRGRVTQVVNAENFPRFAEAWKLGQAGNVAGADAIRAELGLRTKGGAAQQQGGGQGRGNGNGMHQGAGVRVAK